MSKDSSAKYSHKNEERLQKNKHRENVKIFLKEKNTKSENLVTNNIKVFLNMKNKG